MSKIPAPPHHQWVETKDGSFTLFSERFQEACHSTSGAREETKLHYLKGCAIAQKIAELDQLTILEVGFGTGLGFLETYELLKTSHKPWTFLSLELDRDLLEWFRMQNTKHEFLSKLQWTQCGSVLVLEARSDSRALTILCGDARQSLPEYAKLLSVKWSAIYQDAFSPKRNPILWTTEWFTLLKQYSAPDVKLSTYSASNSIRKSLLAAGWALSAGEKFGPKRTSTRADLSGSSDPDILLQLERSPTPAMTDASVSGKISG